MATILCDLDGIVTDLLTPWLAWIKTELGIPVKLSDIRDWNMHENPVLKSVGEKVYDFLALPRAFDGLEALPGAVDGIAAWKKAGHAVLFATAASRPPETAAAKLWWLRQYLGVDRKDVFVCHRKDMIRADLLVDDSPENIIAYRRAWPQAKIATIAYPYNQDAACLACLDLVALDCYKPEMAWYTLEREVASGLIFTRETVRWSSNTTGTLAI